MSCSWTHESKMRKPSRSATVPGPIGVHESAANPSSSRARSCSRRAAVAARNSASASAPVHERRDSIQRSFDSPMSFFTCGRSSGTSSVGSGSPRMNRSSAVMCTRLSCTVHPGHSVGCFHSASSSVLAELGHRAPHVVEHVDQLRRVPSRHRAHAGTSVDPQSHASDGVVGPLLRMTSLRRARAGCAPRGSRG